MRKFFCIGDSHVSVFLGKDILAPLYPQKEKSILQNVEVIRLEGILAYNLCEYNRTTKGREKLEYELSNNIPKGEWVLISAGEVDIRVHLIKQAEKQGKSFEEVAQALSTRYIGYLNSINDGHKVLVLLPPPSSFLGDKKLDPQYPRYGSEIERNKMTFTLTHSLIVECKKYNIPYIEIYNEATTPEGYTKRKLLWDGIHLSTHAFPYLIRQINKKTGLNIKIPIIWWCKELIRRVKNKNINSKYIISYS